MKIAIIGAGISGLSTGYILSEKNYSIEIFAKAFSPNITSNRAAAFWFPYHIRNDQRGINWCNVAYNYYKQLATNSATGISMQCIQKVLRKNVMEEEPVWIDFMPPGILRKITSSELPDDYATGYEAQIPLIETQIFLPWLQTQAQQRGIQFHQKEIKNFSELKGFDIIINCSALGSRELCKDNMLVPVRGQVALLSPKANQNIFLDNETPLYIVPRKDAIIVGGTYEEGIETETTEPQTIERILANAYKVFPELKQQKLIGSWAGLRPYRPTVRVEKENNIIHNYGHGGSGFTLAFGCAKEVASMIA